MPPLKKTIRTSEEVASIRAYDAAMASRETPIPYEQVLEKIERERVKLLRRRTAKNAKTSGTSVLRFSFAADGGAEFALGDAHGNVVAERDLIGRAENFS